MQRTDNFEPELPASLETEISFAESYSFIQRTGEPLEGYSFISEDINGEMLDKIEIKHCRFLSCRFSGAHMSKSWLSSCVFDKCDFQSAVMFDASIQSCLFSSCRLTGAQLAGASVFNCCFKDCVGDFVNFSEASFKSVTIIGCKLCGSIFNDVKHNKTKLQECNLTSCEWLHTKLSGLDLTTCDIEGGAFTLPDVKGVTVTALQACELAKLLQINIK